MRFADITGNKDIARSLASMADSGRVAHAMLLYENDGCGASALALAYLQYLNCTSPRDGDSCGECQSCRMMSRLIHPDTHFVFPISRTTGSGTPVTSEAYLPQWRTLVLADPYFTEADLLKAIGVENKNTLIAVAEAKSIINKLSLTSVSDGYKAVVLYLPEKMNQETANRLLKMIEEPPAKTIFLFITHAPEKVLQTIFSRCQSIRVLPLSKEEAARVNALKPSDDSGEYDLYMDIFSDLMTAILKRDLSAALECGETMAELSSREKQKGFCTFAADCIRKIFMFRQKLPQIAGIREQEQEFYEQISGRCSDRFCMKSITNIEKVVAMIDRNVSSKILFCDLVNRMFLSI